MKKYSLRKYNIIKDKVKIKGKRKEKKKKMLKKIKV